jgi:TolB-like protein
VLPFNNMSGDAEQEFFADGITEDIITELSRFRELFVISRNSSFKYKGKAVEVQKFARDLGVQYVVEGSVRKVGKRVRITVQLIDAETDRHVWAERYDRDLEDIFEIQDEVHALDRRVLPGRIEAAARDRAARTTTDNLAAYECVLTGKVLHHRSNREDNARAQRLLERAIQLDPGYAHAHAWKGCVLGQTWVYGWCDDRDATQRQVAAVVADRARARRQRLRRAPDPRRGQRHPRRPRAERLPPAARAQPEPERRPRRRPAGRSADLARARPKRASSGSARRCASTRITRSASGAIWGGPASRRAAMPKRSRR